jgi:hypothetical protein
MMLAANVIFSGGAAGHLGRVFFYFKFNQLNRYASIACDFSIAFAFEAWRKAGPPEAEDLKT